MFKFFFFASCFLTATLNSFADEITPVKAKRFNHYIGLQANELIRQLVNLNNNTTANTNPYLLTYSINMIKTNWGLHAGIGYDYTSITDKVTQINRETRVNDLNYRIGAEKKFTLSNRFEASAGVDYLVGWKSDKTFSITVNNNGSVIDSSVTTVNSRTTSSGFGTQFFLGFHITEKIMLATETSMYYTKKKEKKNILNINTDIELFNNNQETITTSNLNTGSDTDDFSFNIPVALFLIVKF